MEDIFFSIGVIVIIATFFAYLSKIIRQPLIPAYIIAGLILGPMLGIITNSDVIRTLSEIGIAFLLFIAGLELDLRKLKEVGIVSTIGGLLQITSTFAAGFLVSLFLGFSKIQSIYLGIIVALSSTMVVVKILSDKRALDTLHGKIIIGILIMQDIAAIASLSFLKSADFLSGSFFILSVIKAVILVSLLIICARILVPVLFRIAARSQELLFLLAITFLFAFSLLFQNIGLILAKLLSWLGFSTYSDILSPGFSIAIGAFAAGVGLASLPFNFQIIGQVKPLRDFFSTIFFVSLGLVLTLGSFRGILAPLLILTAIVVVLKPLIVFFTVAYFGYMKRASFITGISLGQISEFSLILATQGFLLGHVSQSILTLTVLLAMLSITLTSYLMKYDEWLFMHAAKYLKLLDAVAEHTSQLEQKIPAGKYDVIICGYNRIGYSVLKTLKRLKKRPLVIDYNPDVIKKLKAEKIPCIFGDIGNKDILERLDFRHAKIIISTVPTILDNEILIEHAKKENARIKIIVTANQIDDALAFYEGGVDYVIMPHFLGGKHVSMMIENNHHNLDRLFALRVAHIQELKERKSLGHEHPRHE